MNKNKINSSFVHLKSEWEKLLLQGLVEDDVFFDYTSSGLVRKKMKATLVAKQEGVWVGTQAIECLEEISKKNGYALKCSTKLKDGTVLKTRQVVAQLEGEAHVLLAYERTLINVIAFTSGIATQTAALVSVAQKNQSKVRITATRKTLPFYKKLSLYSVCMGGGSIHRATLASGVLLKENHIHAYGGIKNAVKLTRESAPHLTKIEVEVRDKKEFLEALAAKADVVMLDNFSPKAIKEVLGELKNRETRPLIEVSGGIHSNILEEYLIPGVDIISVGGLTHSVKAFDFSLIYSK